MYPYNPFDGPAVPPPPLEAAPRRRRWLVPTVLALAFVLTLGVGVFTGASLLANAQAAAGLPGSPSGANFARYSLASTPGAQGPGGHGGQGQCDTYTVSSASGNTITAKAADSSTITIHTTSSTTYTKGGQSASASAVATGSQIHVEGTRNSDGSITATQIDVR